MTALGLFNGAKAVGNLRVARFSRKSVRVVSKRWEKLPTTFNDVQEDKNSTMMGFSLKAIDGLVALLGSGHYWVLSARWSLIDYVQPIE